MPKSASPRGFSLVIRKSFVVAITCVMCVPTFAACTKQSPSHRVALLELYTSEGCDSCPPANEWLSSQTPRFNRDQLVPIALHVDYWDYIGWKDRFANPALGQRHRATVNTNGSQTVFTPEFFVNGENARDWRQGGALSLRVKAVNDQLAQATIRLEANAKHRDASVKVAFKTAVAGTHGYIALLEDKLVTHVTRGENSGATLKEDRVVRQWLGPYVLSNDSVGTVIERNFNLPVDSVAKQLSFVAFVQHASTGKILQATATDVGECF